MDKLIQRVLEEVSLEGREGCTFENLCIELDKVGCQGWTPLSGDTKVYLLNLLVTENPGGHLAFFKKSDKPGTLPTAKYLVKEKGFVYYPISDVDNAEGSLYDVNRTLLTSQEWALSNLTICSIPIPINLT
ncbi:hypothetical protein SARC_03213 [Sphaeroforma arctica JP610]|uniref:General transcription factor 3C polypeptide 1 winged-helix domain-containing protein n=1 Tax=Sphaeroforma arctica JP610 TaxID=667725 RepID=A0A0L0G6D5_9EUKA|nr:hypothetical protein SARC_03213 [Sphaeroforma arctica JP610]KNC84570.1 hypothetical protein SARC_03213 [Sphaeroforma arctica JP610]|eukprot:XP_014158472.1 hypothetical protein SARC_03213 [Sphaeroforma arctica JP610]